jgi:ATP-dependent DNA helicase RecG
MMLTETDLESLLDEMESDRAERKEAMSDGDRIRQAICAFANDLPGHNAPGVLFVGAKNDGSPSGLPITDQLLRDLAAMRDDGNILPLPSMDVQKRRLKGTEMAVVIVHPSAAPPVRYKGVIWVRSGPRRGIASTDDERRLSEKRRHRDLPFDVRPVPGATLDVLNEGLFRSTYLPSAVDPEVLARNNRTFEEQALAMKFAHVGPPASATVLGVLAVGKEPTDWIPGAYVQFVRFEGRQLTDAIHAEKALRGPLPELLNGLDDLIKINIRTSVEITSTDAEIRAPDYPLAALQQLVRNAIIHRSYENTSAPVRLYWYVDRVEVQNPGGPYGTVTKGNFGTPGVTDYRNPNLAAALKDMGYVQRFGVGIELARHELRKNGNPMPEFQVEDTHVAAIVRSRA